VETIQKIKNEIGKVLVGQEKMVEGLLTGLLTRGHILLEGVPGLAKTTAVNALAKTLGLDFKRVQFTPDLLPSDIIGTEIYDPSNNSFKIKHGPIFTNLLLADEINRAPAKVQSALLEVMQERQVTIGDETFKLSLPFLVMATQNPVEQEGAYELPEAQLDRFMMKIVVGYNTREEELEIARRVANNRFGSVRSNRSLTSTTWTACVRKQWTYTWTKRSNATSSNSSSPPANRRNTASATSPTTSNTVPAPGGASTCTKPPVPLRTSKDRITSPPSRSPTSPKRCSATGSL